MIIDYLRFLAFYGRLRKFFETEIYKYVDKEHTTGQHLRYHPDKVRQWYLAQLHLPSQNEFIKNYLIREIFGVGAIQWWDPFRNSFETVPTLAYDSVDSDGSVVQIIIDVDPEYWWGYGYDAPRSYEGIEVIYRPCGVAKANYASGDRIYSERSKKSTYGTLCGIFQADEGSAFGLTCGHVAYNWSDCYAEKRRQAWIPPIFSSTVRVGKVIASVLPPQGNYTNSAITHLDASLIEIRKYFLSSGFGTNTNIQPIASMLQDDPVKFRGANRRSDTLAIVAGVTIRKSMNTMGDGQIHSIGDVLMLGHRYPPYFAQTVSRPGDSGAAVELDVKSGNQKSWYGMLLGSDQCGAYASYSEHLLGWALSITNSPDLTFYV